MLRGTHHRERRAPYVCPPNFARRCRRAAQLPCSSAACSPAAAQLSHCTTWACGSAAVPPCCCGSAIAVQFGRAVQLPLCADPLRRLGPGKPEAAAVACGGVTARRCQKRTRKGTTSRRSFRAPACCPSAPLLLFRRRSHRAAAVHRACDGDGGDGVTSHWWVCPGRRLRPVTVSSGPMPSASAHRASPR